MFYLPDDPEFDAYEKKHLWFLGVLLAECGELREMPDDAEVPLALNWMLQLPETCRWEIEEAECSLVYANEKSGYIATIWDATGEIGEIGEISKIGEIETEGESVWALFIVDDSGPRLLSEYSLLDPTMPEKEKEALLLRATSEIQDRLESGDFDREIISLTIPDYLFAVENLREFE